LLAAALIWARSTATRSTGGELCTQVVQLAVAKKIAKVHQTDISVLTTLSKATFKGSFTTLRQGSSGWSTLDCRDYVSSQFGRQEKNQTPAKILRGARSFTSAPKTLR
jgi:hypothetical protein